MPEAPAPRIWLDDRELKSRAVKKLYALGAKLDVQRLLVADFVVSQRCGIERKTTADFETSILDGRLFEQARALADNFERPLMAVIGREFARLNPKAVRGAMFSLLVDYRIPVVFFDDEEEFGEFLHALAAREQTERPDVRLRFEKKALSLAEQQQFIVESLPLIGPNIAKKLLEHFGSVEAVFTAEEKVLQDVAKVGPERAKEIRRVLTARYDAASKPKRVRQAIEETQRALETARASPPETNP